MLPAIILIGVLRYHGLPFDTLPVTKGTVPAHTMAAVVTEDGSCGPDSNGYSHCTNSFKMTDGRVITVRHDHLMRVEPCLTAGERVEIVPLRQPSFH
jgi:hypothetical protein